MLGPNIITKNYDLIFTKIFFATGKKSKILGDGRFFVPPPPPSFAPFSDSSKTLFIPGVTASYNDAIGYFTREDVPRAISKSMSMNSP